MFARLCRHTPNGELKRRHSWGSEADFQAAETEAETSREANSAPVSPQDEDRAAHKENGCAVQAVDLVAGCPLPMKTPPPTTRTLAPLTLVAPSRSMGQRPSALLRPKISLTWVLRGQQHPNSTSSVNGNCNGELGNDIISRGGKNGSSKRSVQSTKNKDRGKENFQSVDKKERNVLQVVEKLERIEKPLDKDRLNDKLMGEQVEKPLRKEYQNDKDNKDKEKVKRAVSEPALAARESPSTSSGREKHRHRHPKRPHKSRPPSRFGYEIADLDSFLTKASIEKPANIPVVLSFPSVLYQTQGGIQDEVELPLGTVVNAVFKNQAWLYVQTPHGQEGYVGYAACLPLGILPQPTRGPCWENSTDVFPRPLGNMTDTEKLRDTRSECGGRGRTPRVRRGPRDAVSACGERSVDRLYLRAAANAKTKGSRQTLLVIRNDYEGLGGNVISVSKGDVVALLSDHINEWFWVRSRDGREGFIPAVIAGHGFL